MSKGGSQNYLSGNYENKQNSFPNTLETTSVPTAQRFNSFDSSKNNNGTNHNIQQLNNEKILAERNPNQMGYLSSSNVNKHHGSDDFSQKLTNHELNTQNSSKLSTTKINSYQTTCRGFGAPNSTTNTKANKIIFMASDEGDSVFLKEVEKDKKQIESSLMSHKLRFKDKLKEARSMLQQIIDKKEDL